MRELRQFFVLSENPPVANDSIALSARDSHHLKTVLRFKVGAGLKLIFPGHRQIAYAVLESYKNGVAFCTIKELTAYNPQQPAVSTLVIGLCKAKKNDFIIEKATELGVQSFILVHTRYSEFKFHGAADETKKLERWDILAESAANQSRQLQLPSIQIFSSLADSLAVLPDESEQARFVCSLNAEAKPALCYAPLKKTAVLAVGPEGDFSPEEYELLKNQHFAPLTLGFSTLRSETATIAGLATVQAISEC